MKRDAFVVVYLLVMVGVIIGLDVLFLRDLFWWRLVTNIAIVAVFATAYLVWFRRRLR
jgi:hypothetical protein